MKRFVLTLILGSAVLGIAAYTRAAAQSRSAQHQELTIEQVNRWETELSNWGRWMTTSAAR